VTAVEPLTGPAPVIPSSDSTTVIVYTKKPCPQCDMTMRRLDSRGVTPVAIRIDDDAGAVILEELKAEGFGSAPVVKILSRDLSGGTSKVAEWAGFRPDLIDTYFPKEP
jgi:glutaredoxin